jgi:hypothetical protein
VADQGLRNRLIFLQSLDVIGRVCAEAITHGNRGRQNR